MADTGCVHEPHGKQSCGRSTGCQEVDVLHPVAPQGRSNACTICTPPATAPSTPFTAPQCMPPPAGKQVSQSSAFPFSRQKGRGCPSQQQQHLLPCPPLQLLCLYVTSRASVAAQHARRLLPGTRPGSTLSRHPHCCPCPRAVGPAARGRAPPPTSAAPTGGKSGCTPGRARSTGACRASTPSWREGTRGGSRGCGSHNAWVACGARVRAGRRTACIQGRESGTSGRRKRPHCRGDSRKSGQ